MVDRHLRKLDQELSKFKMELEADNAGITEILEQRSLELDNPVTAQRGSGVSMPSWCVCILCGRKKYEQIV